MPIKTTQIGTSSSENENYPNIDSTLGCANAIRELLSTGWGRSQPRTKNEIIAVMKLNAIHFPDSTVRSSLTQFTKRGELRRVKIGKVYGYIKIQEKK